VVAGPVHEVVTTTPAGATYRSAAPPGPLPAAMSHPPGHAAPVSLIARPRSADLGWASPFEARVELLLDAA